MSQMTLGQSDSGEKLAHASEIHEDRIRGVWAILQRNIEERLHEQEKEMEDGIRAMLDESRDLTVEEREDRLKRMRAAKDQQLKLMRAVLIDECDAVVEEERDIRRQMIADGLELREEKEKLQRAQHALRDTFSKDKEGSASIGLPVDRQKLQPSVTTTIRPSSAPQIPFANSSPIAYTQSSQANQQQQRKMSQPSVWKPSVYQDEIRRPRTSSAGAEAWHPRLSSAGTNATKATPQRFGSISDSPGRRSTSTGSDLSQSSTAQTTYPATYQSYQRFLAPSTLHPSPLGIRNKPKQQPSWGNHFWSEFPGHIYDEPGETSGATPASAPGRQKTPEPLFASFNSWSGSLRDRIWVPPIESPVFPKPIQGRETHTSMPTPRRPPQPQQSNHHNLHDRETSPALISEMYDRNAPGDSGRTRSPTRSAISSATSDSSQLSSPSEALSSNPSDTSMISSSPLDPTSRPFQSKGSDHVEPRYINDELRSRDPVDFTVPFHSEVGSGRLGQEKEELKRKEEEKLMRMRMEELMRKGEGGRSCAENSVKYTEEIVQEGDSKQSRIAKHREKFLEQQRRQAMSRQQDKPFAIVSKTQGCTEEAGSKDGPKDALVRNLEGIEGITRQKQITIHDGIEQSNISEQLDIVPPNISKTQDPVKSLNHLLLELAQRGLNVTKLVDLSRRRRVKASGYSDIYRTNMKNENGEWTEVAMKMFRVSLTTDLTFAKKIAREIRIWAKLNHYNVAPLLGFTLDDDVYPCLITEWMVEGTVLEYIKNTPSVDICPLVDGIAAGLDYIHSQHIVHGDLKSCNILVSPDHRPLITDFGISHLILSTSTVESATKGEKGSIRWMAHELFFPANEDDEIVHTKMSDVWAFGMTVLELMTKEVPYCHLRKEPLVLRAILECELPKSPLDAENTDLRRRLLWEICCDCWEKDPSRRPSAKALLSRTALLTQDNH